jgi:hypothetical protein
MTRCDFRRLRWSGRGSQTNDAAAHASGRLMRELTIAATCWTMRLGRACRGFLEPARAGGHLRNELVSNNLADFAARGGVARLTRPLYISNYAR